MDIPELGMRSTFCLKVLSFVMDLWNTFSSAIKIKKNKEETNMNQFMHTCIIRSHLVDAQCSSKSNIYLFWIFFYSMFTLEGRVLFNFRFWIKWKWQTEWNSKRGNKLHFNFLRIWDKQNMQMNKISLKLHYYYRLANKSMPRRCLNEQRIMCTKNSKVRIISFVGSLCISWNKKFQFENNNIL